MGIMDAGIEAIALEKAIIEVIDITARGNKTKYKNKPIKPSGGTDDTITLSKTKQALKAKAVLERQSLAVAAATMNQSGQAGIAGDFDKVAKNDDADTVSGAIVRRFNVQFNPSSFNINGTGGGLVQLTNFNVTTDGEAKNNENNSQRGISYGEATRHIEVTVQLIFDETNNLLAFPGDIAGINVSSALQTGGQAAVGAIKDKMGKGRPSVQTEVEGFLAAIRNEFTRTVTFAWGKMIYSGYVNRVSTKYTLFNPSGKPVRATVDMTIVCTDSDVAANTMGYWEDKYKEFFKADHSYASARNSLVNFSTFGG